MGHVLNNPDRMVRKQTYISAEQDRQLKALARQEETTEAEIIRRALEQYIRAEKAKNMKNPLLGLIGISGHAEGPGDGSVNHDKYIYGRM